VIICGIEAHACVLQTAIDLLSQGFIVYVVVDAVSSRSLTDRYRICLRISTFNEFTFI